MSVDVTGDNTPCTTSCIDTLSTAYIDTYVTADTVTVVIPADDVTRLDFVT